MLLNLGRKCKDPELFTQVTPALEAIRPKSEEMFVRTLQSCPMTQKNVHSWFYGCRYFIKSYQPLLRIPG